MDRHYFQKVENKWQKRWLEEKIYEPSLKRAKNPFYNLMMFPYPSAEGLHVGNMYAFVGSDIYGRFKRMQGYDVFEPIGLDGFGIHSENYALKIGKHPADQAKVSEKNFYLQLQMIGNGFAWEERLETYDPEYYKWTQWIFAQMFKRGLAYRKKAPVNWCPACKTVLADEQVIQKSPASLASQSEAGRQTLNSKHEIKIGVCERCETAVIKKELEQWFFRITKYAERLLKNLERIDWSEEVKVAQRNWISRSEGVLIRFPIVSRINADKSADQCGYISVNQRNLRRQSAYVEVFTTRPDTLFGTTYMVLAPEHLLLGNKELGIRNYEEVRRYVQRAGARSEQDRTAERREKTGVEIKGIKVINPATKEEIPIWVADYVLGHVGTGAIMAVPAHDQRDFEFARKYNLPIKIVVCPHYPETTCPILDKAYEGQGHLVASGRFDGMPSEKAKWGITKFVGAKRKVQYRLRDWLISRQRYWGPPIPMIYCEKCARSVSGSPTSRGSRTSFNRGELENPGWFAVPERDLPVRLPYIENFRPTGTEKSPLAANEKFYKVRCPNCKNWARRETDVSDTFFDSSWYYLGYLMKFGNWKLPARFALRSKAGGEIGNSALSRLARKWLPVDMYIGGVEHAVLHLLYVRFLAMALHDWGLVHFEEPFKKFRAHGLLISQGAKMSKSRGNVVNPDEYIEKYGADALRMYLMFLGPFEQGGDFRDVGIRGVTRFLERVRRFCLDYNHRPTRSEKSKFHPNSSTIYSGHSDVFVSLGRVVHRTVKKVTEDIDNLQYNTAISALMVLLNEFEANPSEVAEDHLKPFLKLLAPFAPHMAEEVWRGVLKNKESIHISPWPSYDPGLVKESVVDLVVQVNGKVRAVVKLPAGSSQSVAEGKARSDVKVAKHLSGEPKRVIFVKDRFINFVV